MAVAAKEMRPLSLEQKTTEGEHAGDLQGSKESEQEIIFSLPGNTSSMQ